MKPRTTTNLRGSKEQIFVPALNGQNSFWKRFLRIKFVQSFVATEDCSAMSQPKMEGFLYKSKQPRSSTLDVGKVGQRRQYRTLLPIKKWQKRWFVLRERGQGHFELEYYANQSRKKPKGMFDLNRCVAVTKIVDPPGVSKEFRHVFQIDICETDYLLTLGVASEAEMRRWIKHLCEVCGLFEDCDEERDSPSTRVSANQLSCAPSAKIKREESPSRPTSTINSHLTPEVADFSPPRTPSVLSGVGSDGLVPAPPRNVDHPYIFLRNCISGPRPSVEFLHDPLIRQPSIPEEAAPPPPEAFSRAKYCDPEIIPETDFVDSDNLYRIPPSCTVYVKSGQNHRFELTPRGSINSMNGTLVSRLAIYDSPPSRAEALRHNRSRNIVPGHDLSVTESTYDHLPRTCLTIFDRKQSLPTDTRTFSSMTTYDQVPLPIKPAAVGSSMTLPYRRSKALEDSKKLAPINYGPVYDKPPRRTGDSVVDGKIVSAPLMGPLAFYDLAPSRAPLSKSVSHKPLSPLQENGSPPIPPIVNRNTKPLVESDGANDTVDHQTCLTPVESPPPQNMSTTRIQEGVASVFTFDTKVKRSNSQENLPYRATQRNYSDLMQRRNTGNSSSLKPSYSTNGVEYTRIEFGLDSAEIMSKSRTLPRRFHTQQSTPEARSPPVKVVGISGTEYKHIDPIKTKALHITKKEHESTLLRS